MPEGMYRIGIVGATSLAGKELAEELQDSLLAASDFILLDEEETGGQVAAVGDEPAVIQPIDATSFDRMDFVFFTGNPEDTSKHWQTARRAGASLVDLTFALEGQAGVPVRSPMIEDSRRKPLDLETVAVVAAHPAAVMLALVVSRLRKSGEVHSFAATVFEPASQHGREAMDELHQQTVNLLSFQTLPREQYDAQVAFNLLPSLGEDSKVKLQETRERILRHYGAIAGAIATGLPELSLQLVQAPAFHGYTASVFVEMAEETSVETLEKSLSGESIDVVAEASDPPSNLSAAGQEDVMVKVTSVGASTASSCRFWLWLAADNLKLGALNAISCANELKRLRPRGKVQ